MKNFKASYLMQDIWYVIPSIISQVLSWLFKAVSAFKYKF